MRQRVITGLLFALAVAAFIVPGRWTVWPPLALFVLVAVMAGRELAGALKARQIDVPTGWTIAGGCLFLIAPLIGLQDPPHPLVSLGGFGLILAGYLGLLAAAILIRHGAGALPSAASTVLAASFIAWPLAAGGVLLTLPRHGWGWLVIALTAPWLADVCAYFLGVACGRKKILPTLSPKKTWAGFFGGLIGGVSLMAIARLLPTGDLPALDGAPAWIAWLGGGILIGLVAQIGDWLCSGIKRWCRIKDFGGLMPGHGGVLDRFDSAFFCLPAALLLALLWGLVA